MRCFGIASRRNALPATPWYRPLRSGLKNRPPDVAQFTRSGLSGGFGLSSKAPGPAAVRYAPAMHDFLDLRRPAFAAITAPAPTAAAPAPATPAASAVPGPAAPLTAGSTCGLPDFASSALTRLNQRRAAGASCRSAGNFAPAAALSWSTVLTQAADAHSRDMASKNFFSHMGTGGSTLSSRVNATGFAWSNLGENIAAGYPGVDAVIDGWMASDGHCANVMKPAFDRVGLSCVSGTDANTYGSYWTLDLARSR